MLDAAKDGCRGGQRALKASEVAVIWAMTLPWRCPGALALVLARRLNPPFVAVFGPSAVRPGSCGGFARRIAASATSPWLDGYCAHSRGPRSWHLEGPRVPGYNVPCCDHHGGGLARQRRCLPGLRVVGAQADPGWWSWRRPSLTLSGASRRSMLPSQPSLVALGPQGHD
jgi:hypothetical protein